MEFPVFKPHRPVWLIFWGAALFCLFYQLGDFALKDWDEAVYAEVMQEILRSGDWLTLHYNHEPYYNKPPLYFWLGQFAPRLLGFSEFSSRLPAIIFALLTLWATMGLGKSMNGAWTGLASGFILLSSAMFLENGSRHATPDSLLLFFSTTALWAQFHARRTRSHHVLPVILFGLAFMTKGFAAAPLPITLLVLHILLRDYKLWTVNTYIHAIAWLCLIILPWYVAETHLHGLPFWHKHFVFMTWQRATETGFLHYHHPWYYFEFIGRQIIYLWPMGILLLGTLLMVFLTRSPRHSLPVTKGKEVLITLLVAFTAPIAVFSAAKNQTWWYILSSLPPLCILGGLIIHQSSRHLTKHWPGRLLLTCSLALLFFTGVNNIHTTLTGQVHNGNRVYGARAELAKKVEGYVKALKLVSPVIASPLGESPSMATYISHRVEFQRDYLTFLDDKNSNSKGKMLVIDKHKVLNKLPPEIDVRILENAGDWALALLEKS